jgi:hypothetical protein
VPMNRLANFARDRKFVSIRRDNIDAHPIHGFILGFSDKLVLIQHVYDFVLDGLVVLRTADITGIKCDTTNKLQKKLLIAEGIFQKIPFESTFDLCNWKSIMSMFSQRYRLIIIEDERPEEQVFLIGKIEKITKNNVCLRYFSGTGKWDKKPTKQAFSNITSCKVDANYINVYQRYFERLALQATHPHQV